MLSEFLPILPNTKSVSFILKLLRISVPLSFESIGGVLVGIQSAWLLSLGPVHFYEYFFTVSDIKIFETLFFIIIFLLPLFGIGGIFQFSLLNPSKKIFFSMMYFAVMLIPIGFTAIFVGCSWAGACF